MKPMRLNKKSRTRRLFYSLKAPGQLSRFLLVRTERLELSHLAALEPKSSVSTNSTTSAFEAVKAKAPDYKSGASFEYGVDEGDRTLDNGSHNPVLYQLSYAHHIAL